MAVAAGDTSSGAQKTQTSSQELARMATALQQLVAQFQFEKAETHDAGGSGMITAQADHARKVPTKSQTLSPMITAATPQAVAASQGRLTKRPIFDR
jgi:hypothetical protein